jgi:hypothetical protein
MNRQQLHLLPWVVTVLGFAWWWDSGVVVGNVKWGCFPAMVQKVHRSKRKQGKEGVSEFMVLRCLGSE